MALPRPSRPGALWRDLKAFVAQQEGHKIGFAALAVMMPALIVVGFITDARTNILPGRQIVYVQSWPADRSDAEIKAQQKIDQAKREELMRARQREFQKADEALTRIGL